MKNDKTMTPKAKGIKFVLYDIILNVFKVDEAYEAHARIDHKFILISTPGNSFRNKNDDPALFDFFRDDTYRYHSSEKVNTRIRVFSNTEEGTFSDYYARISAVDYFILSCRFKKLWIQQKESLMWLTNLLVAISAILMTTIVSLNFANPKEIQKIELTTPVKIDNDQFIILEGSLDKETKIDSTQLRLLLEKLNKDNSVRVILDKKQIDYLIDNLNKTEK
jgi:hypothetical protein